jgi:hypothetical protein
MRRIVFLCVAVCAFARPARAQTRVYVEGDVFAEMPKFSRLVAVPDSFGTSDITVPPDSITAGGGGRVGVFLSPEWSVELGVDVGRTLANSRTTIIQGPPGLTPPAAPQPYTSGTTNSYGATSVLLGYHLPSHGRMHVGLLGGLSFMHRVSSYDSPSVSTTTGYLVVPPSQVPALVTTMTVTNTEYDVTNNVLTATVGAEAAIDVSDRVSIIPEIRVHAGGIGAILLRPGVAVRWRW